MILDKKLYTWRKKMKGKYSTKGSGSFSYSGKSQAPVYLGCTINISIGGPVNSPMQGYQSKGLDALLGPNPKRGYHPMQSKYFEAFSDKGGSQGAFDSKDGFQGSYLEQMVFASLYRALNQQKESERGNCEVCGAPVKKPMTRCFKCAVELVNHKRFY